MAESQTLQHVFTASVGALVILVATKALDWIVGRSKAGREQRDELRADLKANIERRQAAEKEADHQVERRKAAEAEAERYRKELAHTNARLEDAEAGSRYGLEMARKVRAIAQLVGSDLKTETLLAEVEARLKTCAKFQARVHTLEATNEVLREEVRRLREARGE